MKITRHNYEMYLIDYLEGNLDTATVNEVLRFLEKNPDIKAEFEGISEVSVHADHLLMPGKEGLKKTETAILSFDEKCIAFHEGDLNENEIKELKREIASSPEKEKDLKLYGMARLKPDAAIVFPGKQSLKRNAFIFRKSMIYTSLSAAAGLLLIAGFFALNSNNTGAPSGATLAQGKSFAFENITLQPRFFAENEKIVTPEPEKKEKKISTRPKNNLHQPEFIAVQIPDEKLNDDNNKKVKQPKENNDTTKTLIIPNEILLKQNEKQLAKNKVKNPPAEKKSGFLYYLEQGVKGVRNLTGKDVDLSRKTDENGNTQQIAFNIGKFKVSHTKGE